MKQRKFFKVIVVLFLSTVLIGCTTTIEESGAVETPQTVNTPQTAPSEPNQPDYQPTIVWIDPALPLPFTEALQLPVNLETTDDREQANMQITSGPEHPLSTWIYCLVAPFPTIPDGITAEDLTQFWQGAPTGGNFPVNRILVDETTRAMVESVLGKAGSSIKVVDSDDLLDGAWTDEKTWAIVPFEELHPRWKVITVDQISPIHKDFDAENYLLSTNISVAGSEPIVTAVEDQFGLNSPGAFAPKSNRDSEKLTTVALTGVTALVRATAGFMENLGLTYPGQDIRDWLIEADITHINNEIPFTPKCPPPYPREESLVFCSQPEYAELLQDIGTDIVELSGDHFQDWGPEAVLYTLELYDDLGWETYGGGENLEDARQPILVEHNGNHLAFLGCNAKALGYAGASETQPGAFHCDNEWMHAEIARLVEEGYLPIVTFQHKEYYSYEATDPQMLEDFQGMADAGAVIVSGSQAHLPQSMAFMEDSFLHYGLGNLFFDQYDEGIPTRQAFIDRHVFYNGKHISTELLTIMFIDYARPRPMTQEERTDLLDTIFEASGWELKKP